MLYIDRVNLRLTTIKIKARLISRLISAWINLNLSFKKIGVSSLITQFPSRKACSQEQ